jgi:hypothetical protein
MAELSEEARDKLPKKDFGLPDERKYPMPDKAHARNAKSRAKQEYNAGNLSKAEMDKIFSKANKILAREGI